MEFLRVNGWIKKWLDINYDAWSVKFAGYEHMTLPDKIEAIRPFLRAHEVTVCEDVTEHYEYWQKFVNADKNDCCNLRKG